MEAEFWHQRWETNDTGWDQQQPNRFLVQHWSGLEVPKGSTVFVPLCGKSIDMAWLLQAGYRVLGVELDESAVQAFFANQDLVAEVRREGSFIIYESDSIQVFVGDIFQLPESELSGVAAVYDRASLIALPPQMRRDYVKLLTRVVPEEAPTLLVTFEKPENDGSGPPFSVDVAEVNELFSNTHDMAVLDQQPFRLGPTEVNELAFHVWRKG